MCALKLQYKAGIKQQKKDLNTCKYHGLEEKTKKMTIQHFQMSLEPTKINKHIIGYLQFLG